MRLLTLAMMAVVAAPAAAEEIKGTVVCAVKAEPRTKPPPKEASEPKPAPSEKGVGGAAASKGEPAPDPGRTSAKGGVPDDKPGDKAVDKASEKTDDKPAPGIVVWVEGLRDAEPSKDKAQLSQKEGQFEPRLLVAPAGQTVTFPNQDNVAHNVFSLSETQRFNLGIYPKGETKDVVFTKPGIIDVYCSLHKSMKAVIIVTPSSRFAVCREGEPFTIGNVPPGTYKVTAWRSGFRTSTTEVVVPAKGVGDAAFTLEPAPDEPKK